jgi:TatD DNase family protein
MSVGLVDTHAHLDMLGGELPRILAEAAEAGVVGIAAVGIDLESSRRAIDYARNFEPVKAVVGIHPHEASTVSPEIMEELRALARHEQVVGIGETGLDFYRDRSHRSDQERSFRWHIELARELSLPLVVHDREAHLQTVEILREYAPFEDKLILHCFSGDLEMARQCIEMGGYISVAGPVTFRNARGLQELVRKLPLDRLLLETDCPFLSPHPFRGKSNYPSRLPIIARAVAELKGVALEEVAERTTANWFHISSHY